MIHLVLVRFDSEVRKELPSSILEKFDSINVVWTSDPQGQYLKNTNECFEFSGYQEGLSRFLALQKTNLEINNVDRHAIIFANDTIFSGHLSCMRNFMIRSLMNLSTQPGSLCSVTGLVMPTSNAQQTLIGNKGYFSSWLFMIEGEVKKLSDIRFYPQGMQMNFFTTEIEPRLPMPYKSEIEQWLYPKSLMRGWYKASFGKKLALEIVQRKRFSIYLELSLMQYLHAQGVETFCISKRVGFLSRITFRMLRVLDRIYVNLLKLYFRFISKRNQR